MSTQRIAVIGGGNIGGTLGRAWAAAHHDVTFGVRDPASAKAKALPDDAPGASLASVEDAVRDADVVLLAVPGGAVAELTKTIAPHLAGRIVIDATNTLGDGPMHAIPAITASAPGAHVFRAFSTLGWENFAQPTFVDGTADLFYCGPAGDPDIVVNELIEAVGLRPVRLGDLDQADVLDGLTRVWFALAIGQGRGRHLALKLLSD